MDYTPTLPTLVFLTLFLVLYVAILARNTVRNRIDLYDFALLAMVAAVPAVFVWFPRSVVWVTRVLGVEFPFEVLFGVLFLVVFVHLYSLVIRVNAQRRALGVLVQELAMAREALEGLEPARREVAS